MKASKKTFLTMGLMTKELMCIELVEPSHVAWSERVLRKL